MMLFMRLRRWWPVAALVLLASLFGVLYQLPTAYNSLKVFDNFAASQAPGQVTDPVVVAAGDIAGCNFTTDSATATLVDSIPGTVLTLGDHVYPSGTTDNFNNCYDPVWGRHKARTQPAPGNHDMQGTGGVPYYTYFGANAGPNGLGYYSYDLGAWHVVSLSSPSSAQTSWLLSDLAGRSRSQCLLAYWHVPAFSSGTTHGGVNPNIIPMLQILYDNGVDVVLNAHEHIYERFGLQNPAGQADPVNGFRQITVGTGGAGLSRIGTVLPNSEVRNANTHGVLKLTLHPTSYDWQFIPVAGKTFTDSGATNCGGVAGGADAYSGADANSPAATHCRGCRTLCWS